MMGISNLFHKNILNFALSKAFLRAVNTTVYIIKRYDFDVKDCHPSHTFAMSFN